MEYDADKAMPVNPTVDFFNKHLMELVTTSMRLQPNIDGISDEDVNAIKFKAMDIVAKKYEFGKYRHLCKTCHKNLITCKANPMFGKNEGNLNVCFCLGYSGKLSLETVSKGLSGIEYPKE